MNVLKGLMTVSRYATIHQGAMNALVYMDGPLQAAIAAYKQVRNTNVHVQVYNLYYM